MKKVLSLAVVALFASTVANAQDYQSQRVQNEKEYYTNVETQIVKEKPEYKNYDRIYLSYAPTRIAEYYRYLDALMMHGVGMGWKKGINVTGKRLPLYLETGIAANFAFGNGDKLFNFVIPVDVSYRFKIGNTKLYIAPYWGLNFKINYYWDKNGKKSWYDYNGVDGNRFQLGTELGCNFDIWNFHFGVGWSYDFMKLAQVDYSNTSYLHDFKTSGVRVNVGVVF